MILLIVLVLVLLLLRIILVIILECQFLIVFSYSTKFYNFDLPQAQTPLSLLQLTDCSISLSLLIPLAPHCPIHPCGGHLIAGIEPVGLQSFTHLLDFLPQKGGIRHGVFSNLKESVLGLICWRFIVNYIRVLQNIVTYVMLSANNVATHVKGHLIIENAKSTCKFIKEVMFHGSFRVTY